jgi:hypothetical protein
MEIFFHASLNQVYRVHTLKCVYIWREQVPAPWFDVFACLFLGRTDPYLEQSISCHLIPKKVLTFQVRSTESDDTVSSWSLFEL